MEMHADAFDFSSLQKALNIQSWGTQLFNAVVDQMTTNPAQLAVSAEVKTSNLDSAITGTGSLFDFTI
jgi:hypothetical protein